MESNAVPSICSNLGNDSHYIFQEEKAGGIPVLALYLIRIFGRNVDLKRKQYRDLSKGSLTVEAAFVVPLALIVIFVLVSLIFYLHNCSWYTAVAGETAIAAATFATRKDGDYQKILTEKEVLFGSGSGFPQRDPGIKSSSGASKIETHADVKVGFWVGKGGFSYKVKKVVKIIRPVDFIRKIQMLELLKE